jgi:hypothetical protein
VTKKRNHRRCDEGGVPLGRRRGQLWAAASPNGRSSGCERLQVSDRGGGRGSDGQRCPRGAGSDGQRRPAAQAGWRVVARGAGVQEATGKGGRQLGRAGGQRHAAPVCRKRWAKAARAAAVVTAAQAGGDHAAPTCGKQRLRRAGGRQCGWATVCYVWCERPAGDAILDRAANLLWSKWGRSKLSPEGG